MEQVKLFISIWPGVSYAVPPNSFADSCLLFECLSRAFSLHENSFTNLIWRRRNIRVNITVGLFDLK